MNQSCPHCGPNSFALKSRLTESENFWVVGDVHPLCPGHILIIPKEHIECMSACSEKLFSEFLDLYNRARMFLLDQYGSVSTFEHGKIGQTVFHAHVHLLPWNGDPADIVPEGGDHLTELDNLSDLRSVFLRDRQYLFFSIGEDKWLVDCALGAPRFFRDRFAEKLGNPERGNWKSMHEDSALMTKAQEEIQELMSRWDTHWKAGA